MHGYRKESKSVNLRVKGARRDQKQQADSAGEPIG